MEKRIKESKAELKTLTDALEHKLQLKRVGGEEFKAASQELLAQAEAQLAILDATKNDDKRKIAALQKDKTVLQARMAETDALLAIIGGQLTEAEAKRLILEKLYDFANQELNRYLNAEKRLLVHAVENLLDKYAISLRTLNTDQADIFSSMNRALNQLGYMK